jgi:putative membrane protein
MSDPDGSRRTQLANERTFLAWWRTGLTSIAVSLGIGKIAPDLADAQHRWPYVAIGVGFTLLAVAVFAYGLVRQREVHHALRQGEYAELDIRMVVALTGAALFLALATGVVLALD